MPAAFDILSVDIDGTLLTSSRHLTVRNVESLYRAMDAGVRVLLNTARPPRSALVVVNALDLVERAKRGGGAAGDRRDCVMINYNGGLVWRLAPPGPIYNRTIPAKVSQSVVAAARSVDPHVDVAVGFAEKWYVERLDPSIPIDTEHPLWPDHVGPITAFMHIPPTELRLHSRADRMPRVRELVVEEFAKQGMITCRIYNDHTLQITAPGVGKASALRRIATDWGVPRERICAIGDGFNDTDMLRYAGLGVAVANARPAVRRAADTVLDVTNDQDAVAACIDRFLLPS